MSPIVTAGKHPEVVSKKPKSSGVYDNTIISRLDISGFLPFYLEMYISFSEYAETVRHSKKIYHKSKQIPKYEQMLEP